MDTVRDESGRVLVDRGENGRYRWRAKASNGRIVAISAPAYSGPDEARRAYSRLRHDAPNLSARISHVKDGAGWSWVLQSPGGAPLARSIRSYERYATCQIAVAKFLALLAADG